MGGGAASTRTRAEPSWAPRSAPWLQRAVLKDKTRRVHKERGKQGREERTDAGHPGERDGQKGGNHQWVSRGSGGVGGVVLL